MVKETIKEVDAIHEALAQDQVYVAVDTLILTVEQGKLTALLSRRSQPPCERRWALPGCFVELDESAESAARRLLQEMLPRSSPTLEQLYTFTEVNRDPRGRVISVAYLAIVPWPQLCAEEHGLQRFRVSTPDGEICLTAPDGMTLGAGDLAFDHGRILATGVQRLRGKISYTDIAFAFLPNRTAFSLGELQTVFEAVMGRSEDSSNFRRFIRNRYEKTGRLVQTDGENSRGRGRPAALYRLLG